MNRFSSNLFLTLRSAALVSVVLLGAGAGLAQAAPTKVTKAPAAKAKPITPAKAFNPRALNPQPLPPQPPPDKMAMFKDRGLNLKALNPQPLPPEPPPDKMAMFKDRGLNLKALNPQPLPPEPLPDKLSSKKLQIKPGQLQRQ